ncbi:MAG: cytochrome c3 family protein [Desulfatiglandales bacterium]
MEDPKEVVLTKKCLECHGPLRNVAEMTAAIEPNPHDSPHYGSELDCDLCHHQHKKSENFCNECHSFEFVTP